MTGRTLLLLTPYFPPEGGGVAVYALNLARALSRDQGWRVVMVGSGERGDRLRGRLRQDDLDGISVYRLPYRFQISNTRLDPGWRRELRRIIKEVAPDVINAQAPVPGFADMVAGLAGRIPFVLTYHYGTMRKGRWPEDLGILLYERLILPRTCARAARIICSSDSIRQTHFTAFAERCTTISAGVDVDLFRPAEAPAHDRVLFVASLTRPEVHKGLDTLLSVMPELIQRRPSVSVDVVGSGDAVEDYQATCRSLGIEERVRFHGRLTGSDLAEVYRSASLLTLPTRNDSFPVVILEAMASGLPIVTTPVGGIPELVEDGRDGYLLDPLDRAGLVERIAGLLSDDDLAARLGRAGRQKVTSTYTWEIRARLTNEVFEDVLTGASAAEPR